MSNLPVQSQRMKPPVADKLLRDPLKLSFMNPIGGSGECHLTRWIDMEGGEKAPLKLVSTDTQVHIVHSALFFVFFFFLVSS